MHIKHVFSCSFAFEPKIFHYTRSILSEVHLELEYMLQQIAACILDFALGRRFNSAFSGHLQGDSFLLQAHI